MSTKKRFLSPATSISIGLAGLMVSVLLIVHASGLLPNVPLLVNSARKPLCESLAIHCALALQKDDPAEVEPIFTKIVNDNPEIEYVAFRRKDGVCSAEAGVEATQEAVKDHLLKTGNLLSVEISRNGTPWGDLWLQFRPRFPAWVPRLLAEPLIQLLIVLPTLVFLGSYYQLRKIFKSKQGSGPIPERVRATLDTLVEGVLLLDDKQRIAFTNSAFGKVSGRSAKELEGRKVTELQWSDPDSSETPEEYPWSKALRHGVGKLGSLLSLRTETGGSRTLSINCTPVFGDDGSRVGALATFDDLTDIEKKNAHLNRLLEEIDRSHTQLESSNVQLREEVLQRERAQAELIEMQGKLTDSARHAGMAEVATNVLHDVGNVLNSVNVSADLASEKVRDSKISGLAKVSELLEAQDENADSLLADPEKRKKLTQYLIELSNHLRSEQESTLEELQLLMNRVDHIKEIINLQQEHAGTKSLVESVSVNSLLEDALTMNRADRDHNGIRVELEFDEVPLVMVDHHKLLQVFLNLIANAVDSLLEAGPDDKLLLLRTKLHEDVDRVRIEVIDSGMGIPEENLTRIFSHGFTTKQTGHGFGLHHSSLVIKELGGSISVYSEGLGQGAIFAVEIPFSSPNINQSDQCFRTRLVQAAQ